MLTKRIIPCLDFDRGRVVKGVNFTKFQDAGDPVMMGKYYSDQGADELVFLDITASSDKRDIMIQTVRDIAKNIFLPFTVGGGIRTVDDIRSILKGGADKVSLNTAAFLKPMLIQEGANAFGNQCIVLAIDSKRRASSWEVYINGGKTPTGFDAIEWAKKAVSLGAGEILLTSMDRDGTKNGYDIQLTRQVAESVSVPIIASGGAGSEDDFYKVITEGKADAVLAASLFHFSKLTIQQLKRYLSGRNISVRIETI